MSLSIGELVGYVTLDNKGLRKGANEAEATMEGLAKDSEKSAHKVDASLSSLVGKGLKRLGIGFGLAGGAGAMMGLKTAASMENADIAFTTMLGSGKKADKFLKQLAAFAAKTPFEFPELQSAASSLISAGVDAKKVIPIMTTLGNVTSGMGTGAEGVQRATIALQQMQAAGRITGEDLNQLRDAGIPVYDLLAKATGKSKAEVVKLAQAGKLGKRELGQMMKALETGKGMERFSGLMEKQSASLGGMWSTFTDTLNMDLAKAITPMLPQLKGALGGATEALATVLPKLTTALLALVTAGTKVVSFLKDHKALAIGLAAVIVTLTAVTMAHEAALSVSAAGGLAKWLLQTKLISAATKVWAAVQWAMNAAMSANPIMLVVVGIAALVAGVILAYKHSETFRRIVTGAFNAVKSAGAAAFGWIKDHWPLLLAIITGPFGLAVYTIVKHWSAIKNGASTTVHWIESKLDSLVSFVTGLPGKISRGAGGAFDGLTSAARSAFNAIAHLWNSTVGAISFHVPGWVPKIGGKGWSVPNIPELATGGRATGATLAIIGEGREPETVLPDSVLRGLLERVHEAGRQSAGPAMAGHGPLIGQVVQQPGESADTLAERLWFKTQTRG